MKIESIRCGQVTVRLSLADCRRLEEACEVVLENVIDIEREADMAHVEALGAAMHAIGLLLHASLEVRLEDWEALGIG